MNALEARLLAYSIQDATESAGLPRNRNRVTTGDKLLIAAIAILITVFAIGAMQ